MDLYKDKNQAGMRKLEALPYYGMMAAFSLASNAMNALASLVHFARNKVN